MLLTTIHLCCLSLLMLCAGEQKYPYDGPENEITIHVTPGSTECFYQKAKAQQTLEIEYQVIDANFGDVNINQELDINFQLFSPSGKELISDFKQSDANHRVPLLKYEKI
ncbi:unnamed protein product [Larinioides sclopetarius]|uniref:GOLD domain-containing protein n=1 Tax=Larinioides sclopetarius TaxID=280406 RepID=A0AAV2A6R5_9ARAC